MSLDTSEMTPEEAREHIERLGISQQAFARMIRVNPSTVRRWIKHRKNTDELPALDIPRAVQILLRVLSPAQARRLIEALQE
ncbi:MULTISPECIES: helix-turn-helix domain-containing protein [unclassified Bradyrhizobium]|uniref:helix-turn-helix domain-containing protein n=1 Tax=unclassified Bradyrhizobium TaxID=2631580 RepID=UPI002916329C|nr:MULTISPECIES: helix-turn-helix domain-containing protein [unclassified Bradyrhizobium]